MFGMLDEESESWDEVPFCALSFVRGLENLLVWKIEMTRNKGMYLDPGHCSSLRGRTQEEKAVVVVSREQRAGRSITDSRNANNCLRGKFSA